MSRYTVFKLPSGAFVHVQSSFPLPEGDAGGIAEASGGYEQLRDAWDDGAALVRELTVGLVSQLRDATDQAEQVTVEFGVNISGRTGIILVEGSTAANLKVTVTWKN